jgi:hypothetical protein
MIADGHLQVRQRISPSKEPTVGIPMWLNFTGPPLIACRSA